MFDDRLRSGVDDQQQAVVSVSVRKRSGVDDQQQAVVSVMGKEWERLGSFC